MFAIQLKVISLVNEELQHQGLKHFGLTKYSRNQKNMDQWYGNISRQIVKNEVKIFWLFVSPSTIGWPNNQTIVPPVMATFDTSFVIFFLPKLTAKLLLFILYGGTNSLEFRREHKNFCSSIYRRRFHGSEVYWIIPPSNNITIIQS